MEVIVRNLPEQMTEKQVNNYFHEKLAKININTYHCQKISKKCAILTFADNIKGSQFLLLHGQTLSGAKGFNTVRQKLFTHGRPVNCSLSNKEPEEYLLRALKKEESDKYVAKLRKPKIVPPKVEERQARDVRAFDITSFECGQWEYASSNLVFSSHWLRSGWGRVIFSTYCVMVKLSSTKPNLPTQQVEIPYNSIQSLTAGTKGQSLTFSLSEGPKFYEEILPSLEDAFQTLKIADKDRGRAFKRKRISAIDAAHEKLLGGCLCYRVVFAQASEFGLVRGFKRFAEIPSVIFWETQTVARVAFNVRMSALNNSLTSSLYDTIPFAVKFQIQRLAQNGYLRPSTCVDLLSVVQSFLVNSSAVVVAGALRHMAEKLPYAGPDAEASDFHLYTLKRLLDSSIRSIQKGDPYASELAKQYDHIMLVHKATVTPTRIILSGPEPEVKNRVLRKYSEFPDNFLSVSFHDEDGEQMRFDRQTSSTEIYYQRFKKVLEGVINIAGQGFEVSMKLRFTAKADCHIVSRVFSFFPSLSIVLVHGTVHPEWNAPLRKKRH